MANKYYLDPSRPGGQPVQELYDTINYLSGMSASGTASTATIVYDTRMEFTNSVIFSCPTTFSKKIIVIFLTNPLVLYYFNNIKT